MLWFLHIACDSGFVVEEYLDEAVGVMTSNDHGIPWISRITLRPWISWSGDRPPTAAETRHLHHLAHEQCFISASIRTEVVVEPRP